MSRQAAHDQRVRDAGGKRITVTLQPATVAALRELRARGAVSDAAAVNLAVRFTRDAPGAFDFWLTHKNNA